MLLAGLPAGDAEAWCDGHVAPLSVLYDNSKLIVARIHGDGTRQRTQMFSGLVSHYLFRDRYGRPGRGDDKGKVEELVGFARRNLLVPIPRASSFEELNAKPVERCRRRDGDQFRGKDGTVGERLEEDKAVFFDLPALLAMRGNRVRLCEQP